MVHSTLIVLTETGFAPTLLSTLKKANSEASIVTANSLDQIQRVYRPSTSGQRLIAFCTDVIVPPEILRLFDGGAYNFHPGSSEYPVLFPSCFAIYDGAASFGATAHLMTEDIDAGEIVGSERFEIAPDIDRFSLDSKTFETVMVLFRRLTPQLVDVDNPPPPNGEKWSGKSRGRKDFNHLCKLPLDIDKDEFDRRYRAIGEGPDHALSIEVFGHRFCLDNKRGDKPAYRGGQSSKL